jgi:CelD/BcsL family acetyltransferase involved in cellulose biosynthesis
MTIQLIQSELDFLSLQDDWNALLPYCASHVPFLRHEYLSNWWKTLGGGEWEDAELAVLLQQDENQTLTNAAPFFLTNQDIRFLGSVEISDYLDLLSPPDSLIPFIEDIIQMILSKDFPKWQNLILDNLLESSPTSKLFEKAARKAGLLVDKSVIQPAPYLKLPDSWEDYLNNLEDRYRKEILRKNRNADNYFFPVDWYIVNDEESLPSEMDAFLELMADNPQKQAFLTDVMMDQMHRSAKTAYQNGWLQLVFLTVGDLKIAGYLNFDFNGKIWIYNSGINSTFENLSPGWVLLTKLIQWSIDQGRSEVDFMRGDEEYKYQFGGVNKQVLRLTISR